MQQTPTKEVKKEKWSDVGRNNVDLELPVDNLYYQPCLNSLGSNCFTVFQFTKYDQVSVNPIIAANTEQRIVA